ncbi:translation initiation factor IF-2-like [Artibeus jamaicensis]|uniref:translation initiation factor IF-2-like n=1 Tax=Artibeus jamaicensis TaxID=9417 RepID=UPI00235ACBD9|nr:translation initiation factor IF-2-like [Artibeus jamaicensis]
MNWQNPQLLSRSQAPANPGGQVPKAGLSIQSGRLRPHRTPVPKAKTVAAETPSGTGPVLRLTLSGPSAPAAVRTPRGSVAQRTRCQSPPPPFSRSSEPGGAVCRPDKEIRGSRGSGRRGQARPRLPLFPARLPTPAKAPPPGPDTIPAPEPPFRTGSVSSGWEAAARRGRGGGGCCHHVCPPLPEAGCSVDNARRRRGRRGRLGRPRRPRRPPRNKRGQEPRKPGALMQ